MTIHHADILNWTPAYTGPLFHAAFMDAPYEMEFMGKGWDNSGVAFNPETWRGIAHCLLPGAFLFVMAGTLNDDLISVAMREAGLRKYHKMVYWGYGSGFPKATNIASGIDARAFRAWLKEHPEAAHLLKTARQAERNARQGKRTENAKKLKLVATQLEAELKKEAGLTGAVVSTKKHQPKFAAAELGYRKKDNGFNSRDRETFDVLAPATEAAAAWLGHRYGGQMIKPAVESVLIFQKPYEGNALDCITSTGAGALWIDGGRIGTSKDWPVSKGYTPGQFGGQSSGEYQICNPDEANTGRWPANLLLSHAPTCNGHCAPGCPVAALGAQSGDTEAKQSLRGQVNKKSFGGVVNGTEWYEENGIPRGHDDSGTAARFFFQADYMAERLELADAIQYVAKASRAEREAGLDPRQTALMRLLDEDMDDFEGTSDGVGALLDRHLGAPQFDETTVSDGRETPIDNPYQRGETTRRNTHPTIKPLSLTSYLSRLLLPPAEYGPRRILIPFAGAGSECIGAMLAGWEEITGVELGADHVAIADARMAYWQQRRWEFDDISRKLTVKAPEKMPKGQLDMFEEAA